MAAQLCGLCKPDLQTLHIRPEGLGVHSADTGHAVAAFRRAIGYLNAGNQCGQCVVAFSRQRRNHTITVETQGLQRSQALLHLRQRDGGRLWLPRQRQHTLRLCQQQRAIFMALVDAGQLQHIAAIGQHLRVFDSGHGPLAGGYQLGWTNAPVLALVNQIQRGAVKFNSPGGASQRHPQLLIQLTDVGNVLTRADNNLVHISGTEKLPLVLLLHETSNSRAFNTPENQRKCLMGLR